MPVWTWNDLSDQCRVWHEWVGDDSTKFDRQGDRPLTRSQHRGDEQTLARVRGKLVNFDRRAGDCLTYLHPPRSRPPGT